MIDIRTEELFSLTAATKLPCFGNRRNGKRINVSTIWRWATAGVRGVRLETIMAGGSRTTSLEAVQQFFEALTAQVEPKPISVPSHQTRQRRKQIEAAERRLAQAGI
ncbi:MAG: DUF1580 domain-containing protein [Thermoguttaceae bacterium]|jgi:hypothetical protein